MYALSASRIEAQRKLTEQMCLAFCQEQCVWGRCECNELYQELVKEREEQNEGREETQSAEQG